jgi:hypothetical protein
MSIMFCNYDPSIKSKRRLFTSKKIEVITTDQDSERRPTRLVALENRD